MPFDALLNKPVAHKHKASKVKNDSSVTGTTVKDALNNLLLGSSLPDLWKANIAAIRLVPSTQCDNGDDIGNYATGYVYEYSAVSILADDGVDVLKPFDIIAPAAGRWLKKFILVDTAIVQYVYNKVLDETNTLNAKDADLITTDVTTNNMVPAVKHGFLPKGSNIATQFLNGQGNWATPAGTAASYLSVSAGAGSTSVTVVHNFNAYPVVTILDSVTKDVIIPARINHSDINTFSVYVTSVLAANLIIVASVGSPQPQTLVIPAGNYNITTADSIIKVIGAAAIIQLPTAVGNSGYIWNVDNASGGNITLQPIVGGQLIQGVASQTVPDGSNLAVYCDGTGFRFI